MIVNIQSKSVLAGQLLRNCTGIQLRELGFKYHWPKWYNSLRFEVLAVGLLKAMSSVMLTVSLDKLLPTS
jgi:hypothetical protein